MKNFKFIAVLLFLLLICGFLQAQTERWSEQKANDWYAQQPWLVGSNYIPKSAINELEMWQADTFDPTQIDKELGWAESLGMNTMRVFLHDLLWQQDAPGFKKRLDEFLAIAARHQGSADLGQLSRGAGHGVSAKKKALGPGCRRRGHGFRGRRFCCLGTLRR